MKRHLALEGRVSRRDLAVPVRGVSRCSCSRVAVPSHDPGTRLQGAAEWCHHSSEAGTPRKGDQPKDWRAPSQETALYDRYPCSYFCPIPYAATSPSFWPRSVLCCSLLHVGASWVLPCWRIEPRSREGRPRILRSMLVFAFTDGNMITVGPKRLRSTEVLLQPGFSLAQESWLLLLAERARWNASSAIFPTRYRAHRLYSATNGL